jgi:hypothetical protein
MMVNTSGNQCPLIFVSNNSNSDKSLFLINFILTQVISPFGVSQTHVCKWHLYYVKMTLIHSGWYKICMSCIILEEMENVNEVIQPRPYVSD